MRSLFRSKAVTAVGVALLMLGGVLSGTAAAEDEPEIVGGRPTTIQNHPYQVSLQYNGKHICGGTLVKPNRVVTAAHCTDGISARDLGIRAGSTYHSSGGPLCLVGEVVPHPRYDRWTTDFDVSIVKINSRCTGRPAPLAEREPAAGSQVTVTGWGALSEGGSSPDQLQEVTVDVVSREACRQVYGSSAITGNMICAGGGQDGKDACQGDSGGPLVQNGVLHGIVSWGSGCGRPGYPGVYSNVAALRPFIDSNL
ncbi:serine protease [Streptomyces tsukubensis]|uniref:serine protease n=1 Tax=Streptomyces tsukubensis TaxID=83656 RepID=UPI00344B3D4E